MPGAYAGIGPTAEGSALVSVHAAWVAIAQPSPPRAADEIDNMMRTVSETAFGKTGRSPTGSAPYMGAAHNTSSQAALRASPHHRPHPPFFSGGTMEENEEWERLEGEAEMGPSCCCCSRPPLPTSPAAQPSDGLLLPDFSAPLELPGVDTEAMACAAVAAEQEEEVLLLLLVGPPPLLSTTETMSGYRGEPASHARASRILSSTSSRWRLRSLGGRTGQGKGKWMAQVSERLCLDNSRANVNAGKQTGWQASRCAWLTWAGWAGA